MSNDAFSNSTATNHGSILQRGRSQVEEFAAMLFSVVHGMWRFRWLALCLAWATCLVGWVYVYSMPNVYEASTRIYVDAESMIKRVVGDLTVSDDMTTEINVLTRVLLSQPQLTKTARVTELDLEAITPEDHEELIEDLRQRIVPCTLKPPPGSSEPMDTPAAAADAASAPSSVISPK